MTDEELAFGEEIWAAGERFVKATEERKIPEESLYVKDVIALSTMKQRIDCCWS